MVGSISVLFLTSPVYLWGYHKWFRRSCHILLWQSHWREVSHLPCCCGGLPGGGRNLPGVSLNPSLQNLKLVYTDIFSPGASEPHLFKEMERFTCSHLCFTKSLVKTVASASACSHVCFLWTRPGLCGQVGQQSPCFPLYPNSLMFPTMESSYAVDTWRLQALEIQPESEFHVRVCRNYRCIVFYGL